MTARNKRAGSDADPADTAEGAHGLGSGLSSPVIILGTGMTLGGRNQTPARTFRTSKGPDDRRSRQTGLSRNRPLSQVHRKEIL